jgi:hypothetical protein
MNRQQIFKCIGFCAVSLVISSAGAVSKDLKLVAQEPLLKAGSLASAQLNLPSFNNNRETVRFSRKVSNQSAFLKQNTPAKSESQEYWFSVNASQLNRGISIDTSGLESLVRISPKNIVNRSAKATTSSQAFSGDIAVDLSQLEITSPSGQVLKGESAMSFKADSKQLSSTTFAKGTSAFKFDKAFASGRFKLRTSQQLPDGQEYLINVLEKNSPYHLNMQLASQQIIKGNIMSAKINLSNIDRKAKLDRMDAKFVSPDGRSYPAKLTSNQKGDWTLQQAIDLPFAVAPGLWELQVATQGKQNNLTIKRNNKLAFSFQPKTAQLSKATSRVISRNNGISYSINVNASHAGRYEVTGLLYLVDKNGSKTAVAEARTAKWIEPGNGNITLLFNPSVFPKLQKGQRFEVTEIGLNDQSRMSVLQ